MKTIKKKVSEMAVSLFRQVSKNSVSYVCLWILHQPEEPKSLSKNL